MKNEIVQIDKVAEVILAIILLLKGYTAFGCILLAFGMTTVTYKKDKS